MVSRETLRIQGELYRLRNGGLVLDDEYANTFQRLAVLIYGSGHCALQWRSARSGRSTGNARPLRLNVPFIEERTLRRD